MTGLRRKWRRFSAMVRLWISEHWSYNKRNISGSSPPMSALRPVILLLAAFGTMLAAPAVAQSTGDEGANSLSGQPSLVLPSDTPAGGNLNGFVIAGGPANARPGSLVRMRLTTCRLTPMRQSVWCGQRPDRLKTSRWLRRAVLISRWCSPTGGTSPSADRPTTPVAMPSRICAPSFPLPCCRSTCWPARRPRPRDWRTLPGAG